MYRGIQSEYGKTVCDSDAFSYACERCRTGSYEEKAAFLYIAKSAESMEEFCERLAEWFYSGNWIYEEE